MNWGQMYNKGRIRGVFAHTWPTASEMDADPYRSKWPTMSRFGRICWAWVRLNEYALNTVRENSDARVFRFEDIFQSDDRYDHLADLVGFTTDIPGVEPIPPEALEGWLDRRIHKSIGDFPAWTEWSPEQKRQFTEICGSLMEALGYKLG
jgi:hypothetical protein